MSYYYGQSSLKLNHDSVISEFWVSWGQSQSHCLISKARNKTGINCVLLYSRVHFPPRGRTQCSSELFLSLLVIRYVLFCYSLRVSAVIVYQCKLQIPLEVQNMKVHNIHTGMFSRPQQSKRGSIAIQLLCPSSLLTESRGLVGSGYNPFSNTSPNIIQH